MRIGRAHRWIWFFAAGMFACIALARPARGHMLVDDAMDVVISPDRIVVDVRISLDEVGLIEAHGQPVPSPEAWVPLIEAHRDYVLSHLHIKVDGVELAANPLPAGTPGGEVSGDLVDGSDETQMGGYHLEFSLKSPPGTVHIEQDFLKEFDPSDANFVTRIRQKDNPEFKSVQINRDAHTDFACHWKGEATTKPAATVTTRPTSTPVSFQPPRPVRRERVGVRVVFDKIDILRLEKKTLTLSLSRRTGRGNKCNA